MFAIRYFQKGNAHITFKRPDLIEKMNDIIARYFPSTLPHAPNMLACEVPLYNVALAFLARFSEGSLSAVNVLETPFPLLV